MLDAFAYVVVLGLVFGYGRGRALVAEPAAPFAAPRGVDVALKAVFVSVFCVPPTTPPVTPFPIPVTLLVPAVICFVAVLTWFPPGYFFAPIGVLLVGPMALVFAGFCFANAVDEAGLEFDRVRAGLRAVDGRALPGEGLDW